MIRDTDADWRVIASEQPFYGVLANERFKSENLDAHAIEDFYASGVTDIGHAVAVLQSLSAGGFSPSRAVDFGCGVGRLTLAMASYASEVVGVDVAEPMLAVARSQAKERGVRNATFELELPTAGLDWLHSFIVFQHIPPRRGTQLLHRLVRQLNPGGYLSVQLTFFHDRRHTGDVLRDLADYRYDGEVVEMFPDVDEEEQQAGGMTMYDYDLNQVFRIVFSNGIGAVRAEHTDHNGCHGVFLCGRKGADAVPGDGTAEPAELTEGPTPASARSKRWWRSG